MVMSTIFVYIGLMHDSLTTNRGQAHVLQQDDQFDDAGRR